MNGIERLEALNPVPEYRGNPGEPPATTRTRSWSRSWARSWSRSRRLVLAAAAAAVLIVGGAYLVRPTDDDQLDLAAAQSQTEQATTATPTVTPGPTVDESADPAPIGGFFEAPEITARAHVGRLVIPEIDVDEQVHQGVTSLQLRRGPGHYPESALPGQAGNTAIAGLRTTYGAPFHRLDELMPNDSIFITTVQGTFEYQVVETQIVDPNDVDILQDFGDNRMTITSTHPRHSARQRIAVVASLVGEPAPTLTIDQIPAADLGADDPSDRDGAPNLRDTRIRDSRPPYMSFYGTNHPRETAHAFLATQFPELLEHRILYTVHEQTEDAASVRWFIEEHATGGWITMYFGDGQFWVHEMTTNGVFVGMEGSPEQARGSVQSDRPIQLEVMAPIPAWTDPADPVSPARAASTEPLITVGAEETVDRAIVNLGFDDVDGQFQELRYVIRNEDGVQIGGAAASLVVVANTGTSIPVHVDDVEEFEAFLDDHRDIVRDWFIADRFQSVELLLRGPGTLAPDSVNALPEFRVANLRYVDSLGEAAAAQRAFAREMWDRFQPDLQEDGLAPRPTIDLTAPAAGYVVEELPRAAHCVVVPGVERTRPVTNRDRTVVASPEEAATQAAIIPDEPLIEFTNADGQVLGYAQPLPRRPWTFAVVVAVEEVSGGWVADSWELMRC